MLGQLRENALEKGREERVRRRAHQIWEEEGRPEGKHAEHWQKAVLDDERRDQDPDQMGGRVRHPVAAVSGGGTGGEAAKEDDSPRGTSASRPPRDLKHAKR
jgi:hypothetical protein